VVGIGMAFGTGVVGADLYHYLVGQYLPLKVPAVPE
jgi:hypothetical protein